MIVEFRLLNQMFEGFLNIKTLKIKWPAPVLDAFEMAKGKLKHFGIKSEVFDG